MSAYLLELYTMVHPEDLQDLKDLIDVFVKNEDKEPLVFAVITEPKLVAYFIDTHGVHPNARAYLHASIKSNAFETFCLLLDRGASVNMSDPNGYRPMDHCISSGRGKEWQRLIWERGGVARIPTHFLLSVSTIEILAHILPRDLLRVLFKFLEE